MNIQPLTKYRTGQKVYLLHLITDPNFDHIGLEVKGRYWLSLKDEDKIPYRLRVHFMHHNIDVQVGYSLHNRISGYYLLSGKNSHDGQFDWTQNKIQQ